MDDLNRTRQEQHLPGASARRPNRPRNARPTHVSRSGAHFLETGIDRIGDLLPDVETG